MRASRGVLLLAAVLFFWNLWGYDLWAPDEPYFAEGAREMVVDGHWAVPHVNGVVTSDKPPLFFWLIALLSLPAGHVTSLTARLPSALAALGTVALTLRLARRLAGERVAALAGVLVATNYLLWDKARSSQIDSLLCFLILASLSAFDAFRSADADARRAGWLFWFAAALAVLAKGPVGILLPVGICLTTLAADRSLGAWRRFAPVSGPLLFLAVTGLWIAVASIGGAGEYSVWGAFKEHALGRAFYGMHHRQPPWYYLHVLPVELLPWSGLVPGALLLAWRRWGTGDRLLFVWPIFVVLFFSISTEKRDLYILPAHPAFLILAAACVEALDRGAPAIDRRWMTWPHALSCAAVASIGLALIAFAEKARPVPVWVAVLLGVTLLAAGASGAIASLLGRLRPALAITAAGSAAAYLIAVTLAFPAVDPVKSARGFARTLGARTAKSRRAGHEVLAFRVGNLPEAFSFYTNGVYFRETSDPLVLAAHLEQDARVYAVMQAAGLDLLPSHARERTVELHRAQFGRIQVVLIANGPEEGP